MNAELEALVCSGGRRGKQSTYALLLEARALRGRIVTRDEALGQLARRYFASHGPATLRDYVWWSGLVVGDARRGIEIAGRDLERRVIDDRTLLIGRLFGDGGPRAAARTSCRTMTSISSPTAIATPSSNRPRRAHVRAPRVRAQQRPCNTARQRRVPATRSSSMECWRAAGRGRTSGTASRSTSPYRRLDPADRRVAAAAERYGRFIAAAGDLRPAVETISQITRRHRERSPSDKTKGELYRQLHLARIADALPQEPVEVEQRRRRQRVDVVGVVERVEHLEARDDLRRSRRRGTRAAAASRARSTRCPCDPSCGRDRCRSARAATR